MAGNNGSELLDVLIVGAGQAGMAAAHRFVRHHGLTNFHVVEAHDFVGGRTRNMDVLSNEYDVATPHAVELGGCWLSPNHTAFLALCQDLDIDLFDAVPDGYSNNDNGMGGAAGKDDQDWPWWYWGNWYGSTSQHDGILHTSDGKIRYKTPEEFLTPFDATTLEDLEQVGVMIHEESLKNTVPDLSWDLSTPGTSWASLDGHTTGSKLLPLLQTRAGTNILRNNIHSKNAQEPEQVGYLYNLISFKGCNSQGEDIFRVRGGAQAVPLAIAKTVLKPDQLTLGDPVTGIRGNASNSFQVTTQSGKAFATKTLLVTGSPAAIQQLRFDPPWPAVQAQLLQRMPMGTTRKVMAIYKKRGPWWRSVGLTGDIVASALPPSLSVNNGQPWFPECYDTSPFAKDVGVLTCFVEGNANLQFAALSEPQQKELFRDFLKLSLADYAPHDQPDTWIPDDIIMYDWSLDPHVRGAYTGFFGPGVLSHPLWWSAYRQQEKAPNVFLAGSDYQAGFGNGYIEGAVRSGQQAADHVWERLQQHHPLESSQKAERQ